MKKTKKHYWKGLEELSNDPEFIKYADKEFPQKLPVNGDDSNNNDEVSPTRRDFLKVMGFSVAAASLAACDAPVRYAIPWLNKPEGIDPGVPNFYASSYISKGEFASILVKTREGRPIKIESNHESLLSKGATTAAVQASILSLYDEFRLKKPFVRGKTATWDSVDNAVVKGLKNAQNSGKKIALVSNSIMSPSFKASVELFKGKYTNVEWVTYDAIPYDGILDATEKLGLSRTMPDFLFDKSDVVVGFNVDYLGTWGMPATFTNRMATKRKLNDKGTSPMSRIYQFEGNLSLTGSNADYRGRMRPSNEGQAVIYLYNKIAAATGNANLQGRKVKVQYLESAAKDLLNAKGRSLVISSSNDVNIQTLILRINQMLGNFNKTLDFKSPLLIKSGNSNVFNNFVDNLKSKSYGAVIFLDANPLYDTPHGKAIESGLKNTELVVSTALVKDETASLCHILAPNSHFLESWGDAEPKKGHYSVIQPTINNIFDTRQHDASLRKWADNETPSYEYVKDYWHTNIFPEEVPQLQWEKTLSKGEYIVKNNEEEEMVMPNFDSVDISAIANSITAFYKPKDMDVQIYASIGIRDGGDSNNPWLQELPDPITKVTWENYATISQKKAGQLGIVQREGNTGMVTISPLGITVPVLIQPGQEDNTIGIAMGYGRKNGGLVATNKGFDIYPFINQNDNKTPSLLLTGISLSSANKPYKLARTQTHQTFMGRDSIIQETTYNEYKVNPSAGTKHVEISTYHGKKEPQVMSMWKGHKYENHHWGMAIDLTACTGCSACVISCQAENNIPVVGKEEVLARRDMHWMRIDRYYSSDTVDDYKSMEKASSNPEVVFQPLMCQHCNNAPCETVCPVLATTHSTEGLNQMTYNRCIGTRYCANNCPYKVRRFNWFKYHDNKQFADNTTMNNNLGKMVLNPDVTVRSRGVMEKCSLCVQRIQFGKLEAKKEGRRPVDGEIETACSNSCPSNAIVFGDFNDPNSELSKLLKQKSDEKYSTSVKLGNPRAYHILEEINVRPNVAYLTKIRNKDKKINKESEA